MYEIWTCSVSKVIPTRPFFPCFHFRKRLYPFYALRVAFVLIFPFLASRDVKYHEPEYWKFGEEGNKYFRHATGQLRWREWLLQKVVIEHFFGTGEILHKTQRYGLVEGSDSGSKVRGRCNSFYFYIKSSARMAFVSHIITVGLVMNLWWWNTLLMALNIGRFIIKLRMICEQSKRMFIHLVTIRASTILLLGKRKFAVQFLESQSLKMILLLQPPGKLKL